MKFYISEDHQRRIQESQNKIVTRVAPDLWRLNKQYTHTTATK